MSPMSWQALMAPTRLCKGADSAADPRTVYQRDLDRIIFSRPFRSLQDKTQVHPLSQSDSVRTRLTHSLEVATVGRSLGARAGLELCDRWPGAAPPPFRSDDLGYVVQAACLAHDIGNPPFGHGGEQAFRGFYGRPEIAQWLAETLDEPQLADLRQFDGNAQGFRILTDLEMRPGEGGLQLTHAVLGAVMKYPRPTWPEGREDDTYRGARKGGYFHAEHALFDEMARACGLTPRQPAGYVRHPLVYLVEAADDICYSIIDLEDGVTTGHLDRGEAVALLSDIAAPREGTDDIALLRALAINRLTGACVEAFCAHEAAMLDGALNGDLIGLTEFREPVAAAQTLARRRVFESRPVLWAETTGYTVIDGLLSRLIELVEPLERVGWDTERLSGKARNLSLLIGRRLDGANNRYAACMRLNDYIAGLTDGHALELYRRLAGITL